MGIWLLLIACASASTLEQDYTIVTEATLQPGVAIPMPSQAPILTVTGKIGATNDGNTILMDLTILEQAGLVEYTVIDPFEERPIRYRGVLMRNLLALWQVATDAERAHIIALDDYKIDIPLSDFRQYPVLLALQADGVYMQPDYRGPAILVYPVDQYQWNSVTIKRNWI